MYIVIIRHSPYGRVTEWCSFHPSVRLSHGKSRKEALANLNLKEIFSLARVTASLIFEQKGQRSRLHGRSEFTNQRRISAADLQM